MSSAPSSASTRPSPGSWPFRGLNPYDVSGIAHPTMPIQARRRRQTAAHESGPLHLVGVVRLVPAVHPGDPLRALYEHPHRVGNSVAGRLARGDLGLDALSEPCAVAQPRAAGLSRDPARPGRARSLLDLLARPTRLYGRSWANCGTSPRGASWAASGRRPSRRGGIPRRRSWPDDSAPPTYARRCAAARSWASGPNGWRELRGELAFFASSADAAEIIRGWT